MVVTSDVEILESPLKSDNDKKDYRLIKLANGLKVLLVRNAELRGEDGICRNNSAAVALTVDVGSFDDPPLIQGMSHFLEHMVNFNF
jgi:secreted Zn-dependent insulinase-like peptidase